jgi:hypothetical protein
MGYRHSLNDLENVTFETVRGISVSNLRNNNNYNYQQRQRFYLALNNGIEIIDRNILLQQYMFSYGQMHKSKLLTTYNWFVIQKLNNKTIEIIDYGAGQALASFVFLEYIRDNGLDIVVERIKLIEPSRKAIKRGKLHLEAITEHNTELNRIQKDLNDINVHDLETDDNSIKVHLFSNILDIETIRLRRLYRKIKNSQKNKNYFVCVGPLNNGFTRINSFFNRFDGNNAFQTIEYLNYENANWGNGWSIKARVFRVNFPE